MPTDRKTAQLQIRLSPGDKTRIAAAARRAGVDVSAYVLQRLMPAERERFQTLAEALSVPTEFAYVLAALNDFLEALSPEAFDTACRELPEGPLSDVAANYLAAMVELAAHRKGRPVPAWTAAVEPLVVPWFATDLQDLRLWLLVVSPPPFKRRNLFVDASLGARV